MRKILKTVRLLKLSSEARFYKGNGNNIHSFSEATPSQAFVALAGRRKMPMWLTETYNIVWTCMVTALPGDTHQVRSFLRTYSWACKYSLKPEMTPTPWSGGCLGKLGLRFRFRANRSLCPLVQFSHICTPLNKCVFWFPSAIFLCTGRLQNLVGGIIKDQDFNNNI